MQIVLAHNHYDVDHLAGIVSKMRDLGAPTIKAVWDDGNGVWIALEGCHRIRAAKELDLTPIIDEIEDWDEETTTDDVYATDENGENCLIQDFVDSAWQNEIIEF